MTVDELYTAAITMFGMPNTPDNEGHFLRALKYVVDDLNRTLNEDVTAPVDISGGDIGFESYCDPVFYRGIKYHMQGGGAWAQDPDPESYRLYQLALKGAITHAINTADTFYTRNQSTS